MSSGTKVALLSGLVVLCAARPVLDRLLPEPRSPGDDIGVFAGRLITGGRPGAGAARRGLRVGAMVVVLFVVGAGIVVAGSPARGLSGPDTAAILGRVPQQLDPATFPAITVDVPAWDQATAVPVAQQILVTLAENLELENQALLRKDGEILTAIDHGDRLTEMRGRLDEATRTGRFVVRRYEFARVHVVVMKPFGVQSGGSLGFHSQGVVTEETFDAAGTVLDRRTTPFDLTFATRRPIGDRWMIVGVLPPGAEDRG